MQYLTDPMARYKSRRRQDADPLREFEVLGYIAAGTYGRVYKAQMRRAPRKVVAIKKFKAEKEGDTVQFTGLSQSAYRELGLCRELEHPNIVGLVTSILHEKSIYLVFDYAEHDLLQLIQYHYSMNATPAKASAKASANVATEALRPGSSSGATSSRNSPCNEPQKRLATPLVKSVLFQVCQGVAYLHSQWVLHRDLKPANIMINAQGQVKIGDLGLARIFKDPLQSLYAGDKVVVTVWYRAPELLLGAKHYTPAIDLWAIGCIFAEMLSLRPIFKGEEVAVIADKSVSNFQRDQIDKVTKILGTPTAEHWPALPATPEYRHMSSVRQYKWCLDNWHQHFDSKNPLSLTLLQRFLDYNPDKRISALDAVSHPYFDSSQEPQYDRNNCFMHQPIVYPSRRVATADVNMSAPPKRANTSTDRTKKRKN